ncbi:hypothetical protein AGMMS50293_07360 [Spirochaetia bacterium]|nr:hypothetical protein AGMMS50293_07360 [Spirochaetia bacterium]
MDDSRDLRKTLSQNIKSARGTLHISQTKLAEYADISLSYLTDIERCKTWVSDKTLVNIARALNMEAYELLIPQDTEKPGDIKQKNRTLRQTAGLIKAKKSLLRKITGETMDDLILEIIKMYGD